MGLPLTADQDKVRRINKSIVLNTLRLRAPISRVEVAHVTGLNRSTVSNIVNSLIDEGLVWESEHQDSTGGRPAISLSLRRDGGAVIGLEIGVDFIAILLANFVAETLWQARVPTSPSRSQIEIIAQAERLVDQALAIAGEHNLTPLGMGVGLPGLVNARQGELVIAPNLKWTNVPLRLMWNQRFRLPIYIENEANLAALGEYYFGLARGVENFVCLTSGIGLGGGIMISGQLLRGGHGYAGEIGHTRRDENGEPCNCGRIGCWETQVGPRAVLNRVKKELLSTSDQSLPDACQGNLDSLTFEMVIEFARQGDGICRQAIEEVGIYLGNGIADLVNIFNPELVVISGELAFGQDLLLPVIEKTVFANAWQPSTEGLRIAFSEHGANACLFGAIAVVLDDILREPMFLQRAA
jgi:glucokinase-like ROK family protein